MGGHVLLATRNKGTLASYFSPAPVLQWLFIVVSSGVHVCLLETFEINVRRPESCEKTLGNTCSKNIGNLQTLVFSRKYELLESEAEKKSGSI